MRLIDGDALEKFLSDAEIEATRQRKYVFASALNTICGNVRNFPTIESERKKGKWMHDNPNTFRCSRCNKYLDISCGNMKMNFCPNCGADMRQREDTDE